MDKIVKSLQGKKTYLSAAALALVAITGWWFGAVTDANALGLLAAAGGLAGLGAKSERYGQMVLTALSDVKTAQAQHKPVDGKAIATEIMQQTGDLVAAQCRHDLAKYIGDGKVQCLECGDVFVPTADQVKAWAATAPAPPGASQST